MNFRGFIALALWLSSALVLHPASLETQGYSTLYSIDLLPFTDNGALALATDGQGNTYVLADKLANLPTGAHRIGVLGDWDAVILKLDASGTIVYTTIIGGEGVEFPRFIAVDTVGEVVIAGLTYSTNFPLQNSVQSNPGAAPNWFISKIAADGASLVYSTYYGGSNEDALSGLALAPNGEAILAGYTSSPDFPVTTNAFQTKPGSQDSFNFDAVVVRLGAHGSNVVFSTYLGGRYFEEVADVALDATGAAWVAGSTHSPDFPVTTNAGQPFLHMPESRLAQAIDAFVVKLDDNGHLLYSSFWGGEEEERPSNLAFDSSGRMILAGTMNFTSIRFLQPQSSVDRAFEPALNLIDQNRSFILAINPDTGDLLTEKRFGGSGFSEWLSDLALDSQGRVHITGSLDNTPFIAQIDLAQSNFVRFMAFDDCPYSSAGPITINPNDELFVASTIRNAEYWPSETRLRKLAPSLPAPTNFPPLVSLSPYGNFIPLPYSDGPRPVTLNPVAFDPDGTIQTVALYSGDTLLASFSRTPYEFVWTNPPYGDHLVRAVATDNAGLSRTSCPVALSFFPPPANDSFAQSASLAGANFTFAGTTAGATHDPSDPNESPSPRFPIPTSSLPTVWWGWRAPATGTFALSIFSSNGFPKLDVYAGTQLENLISLGRSSPSYLTTGTIAFRATAGTVYYFRISSSSVTDFTLSLSSVTPPPNDDFSERTIISGAPLFIPAHNFNATTEPGLLVPGRDDFASVWWTWTAPADGTFRFKLSSTNFFVPSLNVTAVGSSGVSLPQSSAQELIGRAVGGQQFNIRVASFAGYMSEFELQIEPVLSPANDDFAQAATLTGFPTATAGSLVGATAEPDEPPHYSFGGPGYSVWYNWTAPEDGPVIAAVDSPGYGAAFAIYTGSTISNLALVAGSSTYDRSPYFNALPGTQYRIAVDTSSSVLDSFSLSLRRPVRPANDDFANRILIQGSPTAYGSNRESSSEPGEPPHSYGAAIESVWYRWIAPASGRHTMILPNYSSAAIYTGATLAELVRVDQPVDFSSRRIHFFAIAGTEYQIAFNSVLGQGGFFSFAIRPSNSPANDNFHNATPLAGATVLTDASNIDATLEGGEPIYDESGAGSLWWTWTAPSSGPFVLSIARPSINAGLRLYKGSELWNLTPVVPIYSLTDSILINAAAGEDFRIVTYGRYRDEGQFILAITPMVPLPNDDFGNAFLLSGSVVSVQGTTLAATVGPGESAAAVWWKWTAPASGRTFLKLTLALPVHIYSGTTAQTLNLVAASSGTAGPATVIFNAQADTTYYIRVSNHAFTPFTLTLNGPVTLARPLLTVTPGPLTLTFNAPIGRTNVIQASADLQVWSPISTNLTDCFPYTFTVPPSTEMFRFYRVQLQEP